MSAGTASGGQEPVAFSFSGRTFTMIGLALKIFLLSAVTLTIYRFWGRSEIRRYLWSRVDINSEPLEYAGTGRELFLGFLVVVLLIILPLILAGYAIQLFLDQGSPKQVGAFVLLQAAFVFLYIAGIYQAWRYRLSRTVWRGVRMALTGSAVAFSVRMILLGLANVLLLGWLTPVVDIAFLRQIARNAWYGDRRFRFEAKARRLYGPFAVSYGLAVVLLGLFAFVIGLLVAPLDIGAAGADVPSTLREALPIAVGTLLSGLVLLFLAGLYYRQRRLQIFGSAFRLGELSFSLDTSLSSYFRLTVGNFLIVFLTFGIGLPIAELRRFRYIFRRLKIEGMLDFAGIGHSKGPRPRIGEGLAEAFGLGNI